MIKLKQLLMERKHPEIPTSTIYNTIIYHVSTDDFDPNDILPFSHFGSSLKQAVNVLRSMPRYKKRKEIASYFIYAYKIRHGEFIETQDVFSDYEYVMEMSDADITKFSRGHGQDILGYLLNFPGEYPSEADRVIKLYLVKNYLQIGKAHFVDFFGNLIVRETRPELYKKFVEKFFQTPGLYNTIHKTSISYRKERAEKSPEKYDYETYKDVIELGFDEDLRPAAVKYLIDTYDGAVYENKVEGEGLSYIVFDPQKTLRAIDKKTI